MMMMMILTLLYHYHTTGIIDGASEDKGLGLDFLGHIERTSLLLIVLSCESIISSGSGGGSGGPVVELDSLLNELYNYDSMMTRKPKIIFLNKIDLVSGSSSGDDSLISNKDYTEALQQLHARVNHLNLNEKISIPVVVGSTSSGVGIGTLAGAIRVVMEEYHK